MTTTTESLEQKIESAVERLVREHLTECETAATKAVRGCGRSRAENYSKGL